MWGQDPKDNQCPSGNDCDWYGAVVGFKFDQTTTATSCIVWVTTEDASVMVNVLVPAVVHLMVMDNGQCYSINLIPYN